MMKIFRWDSELLEGYSFGDLIALASTADEARDMLRGDLDKWIKENRSWTWAEAHGEYDGKPDTEDYDRLVAKFEADIAKEPTTHLTLWIRGSD